MWVNCHDYYNFGPVSIFQILSEEIFLMSECFWKNNYVLSDKK